MHEEEDGEVGYLQEPLSLLDMNILSFDIVYDASRGSCQDITHILRSCHRLDIGSPVNRS